MPYDSTGTSEEVLSTSKEEEQIDKTNVTATETEIEFSKEVKAWLIFCDGPNPVHYALVTGVDTDNHKILSRSWWGEDVPTKKIFLRCASGENADVYIVGVR
ncbi:hypothetical protein LCGC14_2057080 [marine sediment metagenome]|uniref:Uncharacterized protein n=1 Tax=marine sediment metagenome TaxID=412755 RepID=A0A0F9H0R3_9ZZZZ